MAGVDASKLGADASMAGVEDDHGEAPEPPRVDVARERRRALLAAPFAGACVLLTLAALPVAATGPRILAPAGSDKALLLGAALAGHAQLLAMLMRVLSVLALIPVALFLFGAFRGRNPRHYRFIPVLGMVAFLLVAASTAVGFIEVRHAAELFVASGPQTAARAHRLLVHQRAVGPLRLANVAQVAGGLLFGLWISIVSYEGMRVGLFTRFLGIFGVGAGFATVVGIAIGPAMFIGWLASVACLATGYWPGGRPVSWDTGRAVAWDVADATVPDRR